VVTLPTFERRSDSFSPFPRTCLLSTPLRCEYQVCVTEKTSVYDKRLCGGLTVYSPLVRNGAGPGKKIGVVGLGGL
jgi:hypothetical protein